MLTIRQSLRLSARHRIHAVQFESAILLLGECDNNLVLLSKVPEPGIADDDLQLSQRAIEISNTGVDLRDTPSPESIARIQRPATTNNSADPAAVAASNLADFKTLLKHARKQAPV